MGIITHRWMHLSARAATAKYHRLGGLDNTNLFSHNSESKKPKIKISTGLVLVRSLFLTHRRGLSRQELTWPFLCTHTETGRAPWVSSLSLWPHLIWNTSLEVLGFPCGSDGKESICQCGIPGFDLWVQEEPLEEGMATHSSILAWRIPRTEEPGRLQLTGLQRAGHNWETNTLT